MPLGLWGKHNDNTQGQLHVVIGCLWSNPELIVCQMFLLHMELAGGETHFGGCMPASLEKRSVPHGGEPLHLLRTSNPGEQLGDKTQIRSSSNPRPL